MRFRMILIVILTLLILDSTQAGAMMSHEPEGVIPDNFEIPVIESGSQGTTRRKSRQLLPSSFDSRKMNLVTPVKDQEKSELCWSFSMVSLAESAALAKGLDDNPDYSERHLGYYFGRGIQSPLNTSGEDFTLFLTDYSKAGGNNKFTVFSLANWIGMASEQKYPYSTEPVGQLKDAFDDVLHLTEARWYSPENVTQIKKAIMENGAVITAYHHHDSYYNESTAAYYNPHYTGANHSVAIIGWDDNYDAENFNKLPTQGNGAWLVKNSWGKTFGDEGCMWISYYDVSLTNRTNPMIAAKFGRADNYDYNYHYDGSAGVAEKSIISGNSIANVFTCEAEEEKDELLQAVGFAVADVNVKYSIQIYRNLQDESLPTSGEPMLESPLTGTIEAAGYYSIPLDKPLKLRKNQVFSIVITLDNGADQTQVFLDKSYVNSGWIRFQNTTKPGQSFVQGESGKWQDLDSESACVRIKAFTDGTDTISPSAFSFNKKTVDLYPGEKYVPVYYVIPENTTERNYDWNVSDPDVAQVTESGTLTAKNPGTTEITLICDDVKETYRVNVMRPMESLSFLKPVLTLNVGMEYRAAFEVLPEDASDREDLLLSSSNSKVVKISGSTIIASAPGKATVTASNRRGTCSAVCTVTVREDPARAQESTVEKPKTVAATDRAKLVTSSSNTTTSTKNNTTAEDKKRTNQKRMANQNITVNNSKKKKRIEKCRLVLSKEIYTCNGKRKRPEVTLYYKGKKVSTNNYTRKYKNNINVGTACLIVHGRNKFSGTVRKTFIIRPKGVKFRSCKLRKNTLILVWRRRLNQCSGYEIKYSAKKNMKGAKKKRIRNCRTRKVKIRHIERRRKYYVRIRTYKKVNGRYYYSTWSKKRKVRR